MGSVLRFFVTHHLIHHADHHVHASLHHLVALHHLGTHHAAPKTRLASGYRRYTGWRSRTITEIAFQSGFSNVTYFGQAFKARYGVTPREYRAINLASGTRSWPHR